MVGVDHVTEAVSCRGGGLGVMYCLGFRVQGLGFRVWGLGFGVWGWV